MFNAIEFERDNLLVHSFRPHDIQGLEIMAGDVFDIFSDDRTLKFLPQKRMGTVDEAIQLLRGNILSFYASQNYLHFIRVKSTGRIIGMIDLITPGVAREHYRIEGRFPYFLEFYLSGPKSKQGIMSTLLPSFLEEIQRRRIHHIGAIINRRNTGARKVLENSGFTKSATFDALQDLYRIKLQQ